MCLYVYKILTSYRYTQFGLKRQEGSGSIKAHTAYQGTHTLVFLWPSFLALPFSLLRHW